MLALRRRRRSGRKERRKEGGDGVRRKKKPRGQTDSPRGKFPFPAAVGRSLLPFSPAHTQQPRSGSKSRSLPQEEGQPRPEGETGFGAAAFVCVIPRKRKRKAEKKCLAPPKKRNPSHKSFPPPGFLFPRELRRIFLSGSEEGGSNSWRLSFPILFLGP